MSIQPILSLEGAQVAYGDLTVIWEVSLALTPGRTTALLGRNGAGKTTLLSALAGLLPLSNGTLALHDEDITRTSPWNRMRRGIVLVQEGKRVFRGLTVQENLLLGLPGGINRRDARSALEHAYDRFPVLKDRLQATAGSLSGGQQQMLALGTAMVSDPKVLLIDEPSSGLAPVIVDEVLEAVDQFKADGAAVLLVEELVDEVLSGYADDVVVLEQGRVRLSAKAEDVTVDDVVSGIYES